MQGVLRPIKLHNARALAAALSILWGGGGRSEWQMWQREQMLLLGVGRSKRQRQTQEGQMQREDVLQGVMSCCGSRGRRGTAKPHLEDVCMQHVTSLLEVILQVLHIHSTVDCDRRPPRDAQHMPAALRDW